MECQICFFQYKSKTRIPVVLLCGHTICEVCVKDLRQKTCPICRTNFQNYAPNYGLLNLIKAQRPPRQRKQVERLFKISIVGESGVGKSSILNGFLGKFDDKQDVTIGTDLRLISEIHKGNRYKFQLWDTGGHERYRAITPMHYKNSHLIILAYSLNEFRSFNELARYWINQVKHLSPDSKLLIIGNKMDLGLDRRVSDMEVKDLCKKYGCLEAKVSCKDRINLEPVWELIRGTLINDGSSASWEEESSLQQSQRLSKHRSSRQFQKSCC